MLKSIRANHVAWSLSIRLDPTRSCALRCGLAAHKAEMYAART